MYSFPATCDALRIHVYGECINISPHTLGKVIGSPFDVPNASFVSSTRGAIRSSGVVVMSLPESIRFVRQPPAFRTSGKLVKLLFFRLSMFRVVICGIPSIACMLLFAMYSCSNDPLTLLRSGRNWK